MLETVTKIIKDKRVCVLFYKGWSEKASLLKWHLSKGWPESEAVSPENLRREGPGVPWGVKMRIVHTRVSGSGESLLKWD